MTFSEFKVFRASFPGYRQWEGSACHHCLPGKFLELAYWTLGSRNKDGGNPSTSCTAVQKSSVEQHSGAWYSLPGPGVLRAMDSLPNGDLPIRSDNWNLLRSTSPFARTVLVLHPSENSVQPCFHSGSTSLLNGVFHTLLSTHVISLCPDTLTSLFYHSRGHRKPDRSCDLPKVIQLTTDKGGGRSRTG